MSTGPYMFVCIYVWAPRARVIVCVCEWLRNKLTRALTLRCVLRREKGAARGKAKQKKDGDKSDGFMICRKIAAGLLMLLYMRCVGNKLSSRRDYCQFKSRSLPKGSYLGVLR